MASTNVPTFTVALTFSELKSISDTLEAAYRSEAYYANMDDEAVADIVETDDDTGEVSTKSQEWKRNSRTTARNRRERLSDLHYRLMGSPLTD